MAFNDSLSDMLARIKNAHQANKVSTLCLKSKLNINVLSVLKDEGYIRDFKDVEERKGVSSIQIDLKYYNGSPVIKKIKRIIAIGVRSKVSMSKPISGDTFTFFLIKPYKLNVRATVIPIQGTSPSLIRK